MVHRSYLRRLGFRATSPHLWLCIRRHGLKPGEHLSCYDWGGREPIDFSSLHLTVEAGAERAHVYFREEAPGQWVREGHTPRADLERMGLSPERLCARADAVFARLRQAM